MGDVIKLKDHRPPAQPQVADLVDERTDIGERIQRIRKSLDKINLLMSDLKTMANRADNGDRRDY
jgi:hypothetical protein